MNTQKIKCDQCGREVADIKSEADWLRIAAPGSISLSLGSAYPLVAKTPVDLCSPACLETFLTKVRESKKPEPVAVKPPVRVAPPAIAMAVTL